jgi:cytochrome c biogenesis protein CcdA
VGAALVGIAFAFGWSPCIGPLLTAILALASKQESVVRGMVLLLAYSAGLGIPLFLAAVATERFLSATATVRSRFHLVEIVGGIVLVAIGIAMVAGRFGEWSGRISSIAAGNEIVSALLTALVLYYLAGLALTVWVAADARRRNKNPLAWSAAALLAGPLGALAYRLARR